MTVPDERARGATREATRRPGPRTDVSARDQILDMAEELFAANAPEAISLRAVARAADVAPAAVNYHFAHKAGLLEAVFARRTPLVAEAIRTRLALVCECEPGEPTSRDLVEAILLPFVELVAANPIGGFRWLKIFVRLAMQQHPLWVAEVDRTPDLPTLFLDAASRALPELSSLEALQRMGIAMFTMLSALGNADLAAYGPAVSGEGFHPRFVEQLVVFTAAGLAGSSPAAASAGQ